MVPVSNKTTNPAEDASTRALEKLFQAIDDKKCFRLEAGAGAGKTYSLIEALKYLIKKNSTFLLKNNQKIACITYTNVAKDEIKARTDNHSVIYAETIHAFSWSLIQGLQKQIRNFIPSISDKWKNRIDEIGGITNQTVKYDLGYPAATSEEITLHHDDVIKIITHFLGNEKFRRLLKSRYPIVFIDEYQDTNKELANSIVSNLIESDSEILVGFFGDHWQKIYGSSACGLISEASGKIVGIGKNANFRSDRLIVEMLNRMRPELPQDVRDPDSRGQIAVYHSNNWGGSRRTDNHWQDDLPANVAHAYLEKAIDLLKESGWDFSPEKTKILMLTNNILAQEQGYNNLISAFSDSDDYLKKKNHYLKYLIDVVEVTCEYFEQKQYGKMFQSVGVTTPRIRTQKEKIEWTRDLKKLNELRQTSTIGEILMFLSETKRPRLSAKVEHEENRYNQFEQLDIEEKKEEQSFYDRVTAIKSVSYKELTALAKYIDDKTPFSTKHGVKGAEFENVLVVCGRGWNYYNWSQFLEWANNGVPKGKEDTFERNRNLFYVACSRPKKRHALLFTQLLTKDALATINNWFGTENVIDLS